MAEVRHLHKNYDTSYCDIDISHVLATFDANDCTCKECLVGLEQSHEELAGKLEACAVATQETAEQLEKDRQHLEDMKNQFDATSDELKQLDEQRMALLEKRANLSSAMFEKQTHIHSQEQSHGVLTNEYENLKKSVADLPKVK